MLCYEVVELRRGVSVLKPGDRTEERLQSIRDALMEMHSAVMDQKADRAQLTKLERALMEAGPARPPVGTRAAPLHDRIVLAHTTTPIVAEARDAMTHRFVPMRRPASATTLRHRHDPYGAASQSQPVINPTASLTAPPVVKEGARVKLADGRRTSKEALMGTDGRFYKSR